MFIICVCAGMRLDYIETELITRSNSFLFTTGKQLFPPERIDMIFHLGSLAGSCHLVRCGALWLCTTLLCYIFTHGTWCSARRRSPVNTGWMTQAV